jgi:hypothetical protein
MRVACEEGIVAPSERLAGWLVERGWSEVVLGAGTSSALRELDARLLALMPDGDAVRRTWLRRIGHYQRPGPGGVRAVWLTAAERAVLA